MCSLLPPSCGAVSRPSHLTAHLPIILALAILPGCGGSGSSSTEDPAPFTQAVNQYLDQNNMAMSVKEVKSGPTVDGATATMTASLVRNQVGGPSTTWSFRFEKDPQGNWKATSHEK